MSDRKNQVTTGLLHLKIDANAAIAVVLGVANGSGELNSIIEFVFDLILDRN